MGRYALTAAILAVLAWVTPEPLHLPIVLLALVVAVLATRRYLRLRSHR